jgi:hypothetical protein
MWIIKQSLFSSLDESHPNPLTEPGKRVTRSLSWFRLNRKPRGQAIVSMAPRKAVRGNKRTSVELADNLREKMVFSSEFPAGIDEPRPWPY